MDIPYTPLSPDRLSECMEIMQEGNEVLLGFHDRVRKTLRKSTGNFLKKYSRRKFRAEFFQAVNEGKKPTKVHGVTLGQKGVAKIMAVKEIEWELICGFSSLARGLVKRWLNRDHGSYLTWDDMMSEACSGLSDAIFHYTDVNIKFVTFAHKAIRNRLAYKIGRAKNNFPWPAGIRKLYQKYEQAKSEFNHSVNFDELVAHMGLTNEQQSQLQQALTQIVSVSGEMEENEVSSECPAFVAKRTPRLEPDQKVAIESANLSDWEMAVLEGYISGHWGWQSEVAKRFGKSRAAPNVTLKFIKNKVLREYERAA